jgi:hypothetical protein
MKTTKTIGYTLAKLDRSMTPTLSTTEIVVEKVKKALIHLGKVLMSMMENGQKQLIRIEGERMKHIIEVSKNYPGSIACSILAHAARIELQSR